MKGIGHWRGGRSSAVASLFTGVVLGLFSASSFRGMTEPDPIFPSPWLTRKATLGDYHAPLKNTAGDTEVFIFEGVEPGGNILVIGGVHANEAAGFVTALLLVENLRVHRGKVVVIPRANASAFTHSEPQEGSPQRFSIEVPGGRRTFRLGARLTNPVHQWPDPSLFQTPAGQIVAGAEARNLNRCFPGRPRGSLTEQVAWGILEVIRREGIVLGVDLHESSPEYPVIDAIVFHENSAELAAVAQMNLQLEGLDFRLEASPKNLRGLSHREWGDQAGIRALLLETPNPVQGRLKGRPTPELVVTGRDPFYLKAARMGRLFIPYDTAGVPLSLRVARHLAAIEAALASLEEVESALGVDWSGLPWWGEVEQRGVEAFLQPGSPESRTRSIPHGHPIPPGIGSAVKFAPAGIHQDSLGPPEVGVPVGIDPDVMPPPLEGLRDFRGDTPFHG